MLTTLVLKILSENVSMTTAEVVHHCGLPRNLVAATVSRLKKRKLVHISSWTYQDGTMGRNHPIANYAVGNRPNAKKPAPKSAAELARKYRAERKTPRVNSVFALAYQNTCKT
jgi:hypothetical protein